MKDNGGVRIGLTQHQLRVLVRATREALAADLVRVGDVSDAYDVWELLDSKLPAAEERYRVGGAAGRLLFREEILRLLAAAEDTGRRSLTLWEVDDRLTDKPAGTSIRGVVDEMARAKLIAIRSGDPRQVSLTRFAEHRLPFDPHYPPLLLPPARRPQELIRCREDCACPLCGRPASWLRTRKGKRYDELRAVGIAEHVCAGCDVKWTIYAEPVDDRGRYDPFGEPAVCRPRWSYPRRRLVQRAARSPRPLAGPMSCRVSHAQPGVAEDGR